MATNGCWTAYFPSTNKFFLVNDAGNTFLGPVTAGSSVSNSQCTLNGSGTSATASGNNLAVTVNLTFLSAFGGAKTNWGGPMSVTNTTTGWGTLGTWTVTAGTGGGSTGGGTTAGGTTSGGTTGGGTTSGGTTGGGTTGGGTTAGGTTSGGTTGGGSTGGGTTGGGSTGGGTTGGGTTGGGTTGGGTTGGTTPSGPPAALSVTPKSGAGSNALFTYTFADAAGYTDINYIYAVIHTSVTTRAGCWTAYVPSTNLLYLANDAGTALLSPITPGTNATVSNSQCTLNAAGSMATGSGAYLTLKLSISFSSAFDGPKNNYGAVVALTGQTAGWATLGTWTVQ